MPLMPPHWSDKQFEEDLERARLAFIDQRNSTNTQFASIRSAVRTTVEALFQDTADLTRLTPETVNAHPDYRWSLGYCVMPPISADDLRTLTGSPLRKRVLSSEEAAALADVICRSLDRDRFPWLQDDRPADPVERALATAVTSDLIASERMKTLRRNAPAAEQQALVSDVLTTAGFREVPKPRRIESLDQLARGTFCGETLVGPDAAKADRPVRLLDGRMLGIGCKVTNSSINSRKRLLKDIASDAESWRRAFGTSLIPVAVVSGVIDLNTLKEAQNERGTFVVWQHNLAPLTEFVQAAAA
jgi:hypothetical protein